MSVKALRGSIRALQEEEQDIFGRMHGVWLAKSTAPGPAAFSASSIGL